ncbi:MAG: M14 family metallocarboxypeptidase [Alteromonadaceae bacterium]|nr:M14 family metallocarboxypeptidase [Alteromonadaceae bacterium]
MYPLGTPGVPWGEHEKLTWCNQQSVKRSYQHEVVEQLKDVPDSLTQIQYGALPYDADRYPLYALVSSIPQDEAPWVLITGGVHGYETSGVQGALLFARQYAEQYAGSVNFIIAPCVSPWGYETINRWNPLAVDPNRSFKPDSSSPEAQALMAFVNALPQQFLLHIDLHETTDTDNSEFRPALAARDAIEQKHWNIPDGFYLVADTQAPNLPLQQAIIDNVKKVTHIAPADDSGLIIGEEVPTEGVICYDKKSLFLCGGFSNAQYCSTTEVYPDSPHATPEICNEAQVAAITGALSYLLATE